MKQSSTSHILWYEKPAEEWVEALPIGNGRLGAMIFGQVTEELIALNEDSIWYGGPKKRTNTDTKDYIPKIQKLLFDGQPEEAEYLAKMAMTSSPKYVNPYQPLGEMKLFLKDKTSEVSHYKRSLDLREGLTKLEYEQNNIKFNREMFSSLSDEVMLLRMTASEKKQLTFCVNLNRRPYEGTSYSISDDSVVMEGECGSDGVKFASMMKVIAKGGQVKTIGDFISIDKADEVLIILAANSTFRNDAPLDLCKEQIGAIDNKEYEYWRKRHVDKYTSLYNRVSLDLGNKEEALEQLTTDERLNQFNKKDVGLIETYFNYGRYLLIASSQPGTLPANLQGIWNDSYRPSWESKYTININMQMNYWPAEVCNLSECHEPMFDFIERLAVNGKVIAQDLYGCEGFVAHHNTNIWADADSEGILASSPFWQMGGAWLSLHLWEHYAYSQDQEFLKKRAYPIMKEAAKFIMDFAVETPTGMLVTGPSVSPENNYILENGNSGALCMGPSMDTQISRELLTHCLEAANILDIKDIFTDQVRETMKKLPETKLGKHGQIMEWMEDYTEAEPGHRHMSHLFALHPGTQITKEQSPELFEGAKITLARRLSHGGGHTGWSRAWIIMFYARLLEGETALLNIEGLIQNSTYANMFDKHPPFQIDGNFGATAAIAEMLLQSHGEVVELLPALPKTWSTGSVKGLRARGNYTIDMSWTNSQVTYVKVLSPNTGEYPIKVNGQVMNVILNEAHSIG